MKTGQMFVIASVFLVGLLFIVYNLLNEYSFFDFSQVFDEDSTLFINLKKIFEDIITTSKDCEEADKYLQETVSFLLKQKLSGYILSTGYNLTCSNWENSYPQPCPLEIKIKITKGSIKKSTETTSNFCVYRK